MIRKIHLLLLTGIIALTAKHSAAQTSPTAPALGFNVFVAHDARLNNNETEGPVAIGGNLKVDGGYQVSTHSTGTFRVGGIPVSLVVNGGINFISGNLQVNNNGYMKVGNCLGATMWYRDPNNAYPPIRITPNADYNSSPRISLSVSSNTIGVSATVNPICQGGLIDFATAFTLMQSYATVMSVIPDNASLTNANGNPIAHTGLPNQVKLTLHAGLNVLNISGADLNVLNDFIYNNQPDATRWLVINVNAPGTFSWHVPNSGGIGLSQCPYILYNFYNTTTLNISSGGAVEGTVFAPFADIIKTTNYSNIEGQVIAQSYNHGGGENHYPVFVPVIPGCVAAMPPVAVYSVNNASQCIGANSFVFTNSTTGTGPLSYTWTFGDGTTSTLAAPTHVYSATGTFNVKLKATGATASDSVVHTVTVSANPVSGCSINDSSQPLTGNSFVFTSTGSTSANTYLWTFGDGTSSTNVNPVKTYTAAGTYPVSQIVTGSTGCSVSLTKNIVVEADAVGGGGGGGLESSSLGDLVSRREINRIKNSVSVKTNYNVTPVFTKAAFNSYAKNSATGSILEKLTPANLDAATTPMITTPDDLKSITTAVDVFSVDYTKNNVAKAVVLAITTKAKAYNHTKSICDRFRGAVLLNTENVTIQGYKFIQFALRKEDGSVEYCIAFAAGKSAGSSKINLQSKWLISEYTGDDSVFNFQVWATVPENAVKLAGDILTNLAAIMPLQQTDINFTLPPAYVTYGKRRKEYLDVAIYSKVASNNAKMIFIERVNEKAATDSLVIPFNLGVGDNSTFSIPIKDGYEYEGHFYLDDTLADDVYMADGNWILDYDANYTTVNSYSPGNNFSRVYADNEFPLYRSVQVNATSKDYISVYKFITAGEEKVNLSAYHSFRFYAKGSGKVEIRLIKDSLVNFADQYKTIVTLDPAGKNHQVSFDDFVAEHTDAPFDPKDVKAVVYTFKMNGVTSDLNFFADEQAFSTAEVPNIKALNSKKVTIAPNPATNQFDCTFASEEDRDMDITLTDITGNVVYKQPVHAITGINTVSVTIPRWVAQSIMMVQVGNKNVKYGITKLSVLK